MVDPGTRWGLTLAVVGLVLAGVSFALPWWSVQFPAGGITIEDTAQPFSTGDVPDKNIRDPGVQGVGVLALFGVLSTLSGVLVAFRGVRAGRRPQPVASWLVIAGGALLLVAALAAVATWPSGNIDFWEEAGESGLAAAADIGWYIVILAGAVTAAGGFVARPRATQGSSKSSGAAGNPKDDHD